MNESTSSDDTELDAMLKTWAQSQTAAPARLAQLHTSIIATVATRPAADRSPQRNRSLAAVCVAAACLMIAALVSVTGFPHRAKPTVAANSVAPKSHLANLWTETGRLFGPDLDWICDLDGELLLGLNPTEKRGDKEQPVCVRLTLRVWNAAKGAWEDSWNGLIECRGGANVDFASADHRSTGSIWVQTRPDGRFAVSHWLNWSDYPELSGAVEATVPLDVPQVVSESTAGGRRMQIVQQVWRPDVG